MTHPPAGPSIPTPPTGPKAADDAIFAALAQFDADLTPARQDPSSAAVGLLAIARTGEPVRPPRGVLGEEPTPGSAVAVAAVACESSGAAGAGVVRAGGPPASGAGTDFRLPRDIRDVRVKPPIGVGPQYDFLPRRSR